MTEHHSPRHLSPVYQRHRLASLRHGRYLLALFGGFS